MKKSVSPPDGVVKRMPPTGGLTLGLLLKLQVVYCLLGIGYNVVSLIGSRTGGSALAPTNPMMGMVVMAVYGGCLLVGALKYVRIYRILMALSVLVLGYGGVVLHLVNFTAARTFLYYSIVAWGAAVAVNLFGLVLNFIGALRLFSNETT
ncbi:MAG: hypothetical protein JW765_10905 [Deltaproteobacteria bacterium]|nr:hypothetical protein [Candidatus Zymogenaceae bacterium]